MTDRQTHTAGIAIASLVLGILGMVLLGPLAGIPAVVCGHIALSKLKANPSLSGRGIAIAGLVTGYLGIAGWSFFLLTVGGFAAAFAILGREAPPAPSGPHWKIGDTVDVEMTLVKTDLGGLACASANAIGDEHCGFEAPTKPWGNGDITDDKALLKPYTTIDRVGFTAAGVWSSPALTPERLPNHRFSVKCKYRVDGVLEDLSVRWAQHGAWYPRSKWYAGAISDCALVP
jgi:Domain of unknown function (DUF4190)